MYNIISFQEIKLTFSTLFGKIEISQFKEVDEFLDIVIQDYEAFNQEIEKLKLENDRLKKNGPSEEAAQPKKRSEIHSGNQANTQVNYDVLKRLSNLEKAVFGKKISEVE